MIVYLGEKQTDGMRRCKWLCLRMKERLCHIGSTAQKTKKVILFNMADCFHTRGYGAFRGALTKTNIWNEKVDPRVLVPVWEPDRNLNIYLCTWTIVSGQTQSLSGIRIFNLKNGGHRDKDRGIWERRGAIIINRASLICTQPHANPPPHTHTDFFWSVVTPITPARPSLSSQAADLRTPHQQIGLGEGTQPDKGGSLPLPLYLKSITLAFTFSIYPPTPPPALFFSSDSGLGPAPQQSPLMLDPPALRSHRGASVFDNAFVFRLKEWSCC